MRASMEALAVQMLRPAHSVDELFVVMRERREHLLSGGCGRFTNKLDLGMRRGSSCRT
jgi:hypothetical protein